MGPGAGVSGSAAQSCPSPPFRGGEGGAHRASDGRVRWVPPTALEFLSRIKPGQALAPALSVSKERRCGAEKPSAFRHGRAAGIDGGLPPAFAGVIRPTF